MERDVMMLAGVLTAAYISNRGSCPNDGELAAIWGTAEKLFKKALTARAAMRKMEDEQIEKDRVSRP